jgi:hypothetical protein
MGNVHISVKTCSRRYATRSPLIGLHVESGTNRGRQTSSVAACGLVLAGGAEVSTRLWISIVALDFAHTVLNPSSAPPHGLSRSRSNAQPLLTVIIRARGEDGREDYSDDEKKFLQSLMHFRTPDFKLAHRWRYFRYKLQITDFGRWVRGEQASP